MLLDMLVKKFYPATLFLFGYVYAPRSPLLPPPKAVYDYPQEGLEMRAVNFKCHRWCGEEFGTS